jgi:predicted GIY-YIG superfamily endonuclease
LDRSPTWLGNRAIYSQVDKEWSLVAIYKWGADLGSCCFIYRGALIKKCVEVQFYEQKRLPIWSYPCQVDMRNKGCFKPRTSIRRLRGNGTIYWNLSDGLEQEPSHYPLIIDKECESLENKKSHQKWMDIKSEKYIYILKLEAEKYYIGQTTEPDNRIKKQFNGKGSAWTKLYKPIEIILLESIGVMNYKEAEQYENEIVLNYMKEYGWENVRGGYFTNKNNDIVLKNLLSHKKRRTFEIDFV